MLDESGTIAPMPRIAATALGEHLEAAIDILGNRIRVAILGYLRSNGPAKRGEIAGAIGMVPGSVSNQLTVLLAAGLITTDPPADEIHPGTRVRYAVVPDRLVELYETLGNALGVTSDEDDV